MEPSFKLYTRIINKQSLELLLYKLCSLCSLSLITACTTVRGWSCCQKKRWQQLHSLTGRAVHSTLSKDLSQCTFSPCMSACMYSVYEHVFVIFVVNRVHSAISFQLLCVSLHYLCKIISLKKRRGWFCVGCGVWPVC